MSKVYPTDTGGTKSLEIIIKEEYVTQISDSEYRVLIPWVEVEKILRLMAKDYAEGETLPANDSGRNEK